MAKSSVCMPHNSMESSMRERVEILENDNIHSILLSVHQSELLIEFKYIQMHHDGA